MTNAKTIAEFDLGDYGDITEFFVETEGDDVFFKLNTSMDYFLGGDNWNDRAKQILLEYNKLDEYSIQHNQDNSKLKLRVIIEEVNDPKSMKLKWHVCATDCKGELNLAAFDKEDEKE